MRVAVTLSIAVAVLACSQGSRAHACSASLGPFATIEAIEPADGSSGFPRNGAIRVALKLWPAMTGSDQGRLELRVIPVDGGPAVEGVTDPPLNSSLSDYVMWTPKEPLLANTRYRVEVEVTAPEPPEVDGPTTATSTFTTSDELAPSQLEFIGAMRATLRVGAADVETCVAEPCGATCTKVGERPALLADFELPVVQGGFAPYGYQAWFAATEESTPAWTGVGEFDYWGEIARDHQGIRRGLQFLRPKAGEHNTVTHELRIAKDAYTACFAFNAWDPLGQSNGTESFCIPAAELAVGLAAVADIEAMRDPARPTADAGTHAAADAGSVRGQPDASDLDAGSDSAPDVGRTSSDAKVAVTAPQHDRADSEPTLSEPDTNDSIDAGESAKHVTSGVGCSSVSTHDVRGVTAAAFIVLLVLLQRVRRRSR